MPVGIVRWFSDSKDSGFITPATLCTYTLDHLDPESYEQALEYIFKYHSDLNPQRNDGSIEQSAAEASHALETAWNRIINKSVN